MFITDAVNSFLVQTGTTNPGTAKVYLGVMDGEVTDGQLAQAVIEYARDQFEAAYDI
jgi:hypothetical protein